MHAYVSVVLLVIESLNFPDFLSIFRSLRTFKKFRALYRQVGQSFFNNFSAFHFIFSSSLRIMYFLCLNREIKFTFSTVIPFLREKSFKKTYGSLELKVPSLCKVWAPTDKKPKGFCRVQPQALCWLGVKKDKKCTPRIKTMKHHLRSAIYFTGWVKLLRAICNDVHRELIMQWL